MMLFNQKFNKNGGDDDDDDDIIAAGGKCHSIQIHRELFERVECVYGFEWICIGSDILFYHRHTARFPFAFIS